MASINGLKLKAYKKVGVGEEGEIYSGSLYIGSKRLGTTTDDQWGGPAHYSFDQRILDKYVEAYNRFRPCPWGGEWTTDTLVGGLDELNRLEQRYKKLSYIGPRTLVYFTDGLNAASCIFKNTKTTTEESIKKSDSFKKCLKEFKDSIPDKIGEIQIFFFMNESDFDINI